MRSFKRRSYRLLMSNQAPLYKKLFSLLSRTAALPQSIEHQVVAADFDKADEQLHHLMTSLQLTLATMTLVLFSQYRLKRFLEVISYIQYYQFGFVIHAKSP